MTESPSPFLPGTNIQFAWDSTSLGYLKTCPRLYQYVMIEGWSSREDNVHLRFGQEYHTALEQFDHLRARGVAREEAIRQVVRELIIRTTDFAPDETVKAGKYKNRASLIQLVIDYLDRFEEDKSETFILQNGQPAVELSFRFELDWGPSSVHTTTDPFEDNGGGLSHPINPPYLLCGHLDRVVEFAGDRFVMDRKTTTMSLGDYYFKQFDLSNQMTLYSLAAKVVLDAPVRGVIIDAAQLLLEKPHAFERKMTYRTPDQLEEWLGDLHYLLSEAERYALDEYWPMRDTSCDKFGGCKFRDVCGKSPQVRKKFLRTGFDQKAPEERWNPLKVRGGSD